MTAVRVPRLLAALMFAALGLMLWLGVAPAQAGTYTVTVCLDDSDGNALVPGTTYYKLNGGSQSYFATTVDPGTSCKTQNFTVTGAAILEVWTTYNNTSSVRLTQDIVSDPTFEFQTHELTLRLETSGGSPLIGGSAKYGLGANYGTWSFPGGLTSSEGEAAAELFPGTYSFEMNYRATANQKLSVVVPDADHVLTWQTTNVTIDYPGGVSYAGPVGDSTWFKQTSAPASVELMPGTVKFHFRAYGSEPGFTADLTFSGGSYYYPPVTNHLPAVAIAAVDAAGNEGATLTASGWFTDPDADPLNITRSSGDGTVVDNGDGTWSWSLPTTDNGLGSVTVLADDGEGGTVTDTFMWKAANVNPAASVTAPAVMALYAVNTSVQLTAPFSDAGTSDTHTCSVNWENGVVAGNLVELLGSGTCEASKAFTAAGVYTIGVTVTDDDTGSGTTTVMVVVYDPSAGFVTGGGWIDSPAEAYAADLALTGKATFGFVARYKKGATVPDGNTEFQFKAGDLNFHSSSYQWLVVNQAGTNAQFKGTGTINGVGGYKFMIWAGDGASDTFRIRIWTEDGVGVETVVYDNGTDQTIGGGNIVVHT